MYYIELAKKYRKSYAKISMSGKFPKKEIDFVVNTLAAGKKLEAKYKNHTLHGKYKGFQECHIQPDLLLVYYYKEKELILVLLDIGSHSYFF